MLFSLNRFLVPAIGALALLRSAAALPVLTSSQSSDLVERTSTPEHALLSREYTDVKLRSFNDPFHKVDLDELDKDLHKKKEKEARVNQPQKLTLSDEARGELDKMGLHGKVRKNTIKWHKSQVKKAMWKDPVLKGKAHTGVIEHMVHKGGSNPKERNHITASFHDEHRNPIHNTFNGQFHHHIYVNNKGLPRQAKAGWNKNNAAMKGQSRADQTAHKKTRSRGKSSTKGKGKQNPGHEFSKNKKADDKGLHKKGQGKRGH